MTADGHPPERDPAPEVDVEAPASTAPEAPGHTAPEAPASTAPEAPGHTAPEAPASTAPEATLDETESADGDRAVTPEIRRALEALLLVSDEPATPRLLAQLLEIGTATVERLCTELAASYEAEGRGFRLARVAGGYRFESHPDVAAYVERFVLEGQSGRLSAAALETLAIIAYKQPISRLQIASIRGVNADGVVRTLIQRGYVAEVGRDDGPGQAVLLGTTPLLLERLGLDTLEDLPPLGQFVPGADVVEALEAGLRPEPTETSAPG